MKETLEFIASHNFDGADDKAIALMAQFFVYRAKEALVQPAQEREALKLALEVLENLPGFRADIDNAITVIKEVLEKNT